MTNKSNSVILFHEKKVRRLWDEAEELWYFSIVDIVEVLTESVNPQAYWRKMKERLKKEGNETVTNCHGLKMLAKDGKMRVTDVADTENLLRLIQSIPSPKAEPFKLWLAQVGYERIQEIEDPELASTRTREIYKAKGYSDAWIEKRMRGIVVREELTEEWKKRGAENNKEYAILTAEISKATFGMTPSKYKEYKGLKRENLRDHMTDLELILNMLGEATTSTLTKDRDSQGFPNLKKDAQDGGAVAGRTREDIEKQSGKKIVSSDNYLPEEVKKLK